MGLAQSLRYLKWTVEDLNFKYDYFGKWDYSWTSTYEKQVFTITLSRYNWETNSRDFKVISFDNDWKVSSKSDGGEFEMTVKDVLRKFMTIPA